MKRIAMILVYVAAAVIGFGLGELIKEKEKTEGKNYVLTMDLDAHEIVCERNGEEKIFAVMIPDDLNDYEREFEFRAACENFTNDEDSWKLGVISSK
jgi:hypothetical protein